MFDDSPTWQRVRPTTRKVIGVHLGHVPELTEDSAQERRSFRAAAVLAVAFHAALAFLVLPETAFEPHYTASDKPVYVVRQVRFRPPEPVAQREIPKPLEKRRKIPVPDPTPDDPEPIRDERSTVEIDVDLADVSAIDAFGIPEGPPGPAGPAPLHVGGDVAPPVKIYGPSPSYTEDARKGRVQGVVILEAIIDALGNVTEVKVLKGLPLGLAESAVETARTWRFEPARKDGVAVPVFYNLTIRFSLQ